MSSLRKVRARFAFGALPVAILFGAAWRAAAGTAAGSGYEQPGPLSVSRYLRTDQIAGSGWKVQPRATNDGIFNVYTVDSRFGSLQARGSARLAVRVKEIEALEELDRVSKSDVFVQALKASAMAPVTMVASFADQPVETVKGLGGGVKRLFNKTKFQAQEASHEVKEATTSGGGGGGGGAISKEKTEQAATDYAKKYLGLSGAERNWYAKLGVDPYTDNEALKKNVKSIARIEAAAKFGMRFVGLPTIPGAREVGQVMELVWKTDPWELRERNRKILLAAGVPEDTARAFENNSAMSPTLQTGFIQSLQALEGVTGRDRLIARALAADEVGDARLLVTSVALLARAHRQDPLAEIVGDAGLPVARAGDGRLLGVAAVEAVFWTEEVAAAAKQFAAGYAEETGAPRELRFVGDASPRVKAEMALLGWQVTDRWQSAAPEDRPSAAPKTTR